MELRVRREDVEEPIDFDLVRAVIEVASVDEEMLEPGFGYIRIAQFQDRAGRDVENALERLQAQHGSNLDGLVLDLRNNPGGVLQASVQVADAFLAGGRIVYPKVASRAPKPPTTRPTAISPTGRPSSSS